MKNWLGKIYYWFLWVSGAALTNEELSEIMNGGDRLTYWMRRSKERLGKFWWLSVFATIILHTIILYDNIKQKRWVKVFIGFCGYGVLVWLIPHVLGCW